MTRHYFGTRRTRHYPPYAPRVLWNRMLHKTIIGPVLGCSCTRCFYHKWRLQWWREGVRDRVRVARLEERVRELETARGRQRRLDAMQQDIDRLLVRHGMIDRRLMTTPTEGATP